MATASLRLYGPNPTWRSYVSGTVIQNYVLANSVWQNAKAARDRLGLEQKAPTDATKLNMPIWGDDKVAIARFVASTVAYNTKYKSILKFRTKITSQTLALKVLDYVSFSYGQYRTSPIGALILEIAPVLSTGEFEITLMTATDLTKKQIITEDGKYIITETGARPVVAEV